MNMYECEEKNNFIFPEEYKNIIEKSNSQWLDKSMEWIWDNEDELKANNAFAFPSIGDFKLIPFEKIEHYIDELYEMIGMDIEYSNNELRINPTYRLIPFAHMSSGDLYCFCKDDKNAKNIIILYGHDTGDFDVWANDFEELIFIQLVSSVIDYEKDVNSSFITSHIELLSKPYIELFNNLTKEELGKYVSEIDLQECPEFLI